MARANCDICFYGLTASPFQLKMQSLADYSGKTWRRWPDQASSRWAAMGQFISLMSAKQRGAVQRFPVIDPLDEYPSVPFYRIDGGPWYFDSSGFAMHLDALGARAEQPLLPPDTALAFLAQLLDEAFDEFGLYMVHHMRWAGTARTTSMPQVTQQELQSLLPAFMRRRLPNSLAARQSRRCAYLFSVAPAGFDLGLSKELTPPAIAGFPETHSLLNDAWRSYLGAMEQLLDRQPYLLGERFTVADASAYGQLSMNLIDGAPADLLRQLAPNTYQWLCGIRDGEHIESDGELYLSDALQPLLSIIGETFIALMRQNYAAYVAARERGESRYNEAAFDAGQALYDGKLMGHPFRAVVKTFQVRVWQDLALAWRRLPARALQELVEFLPFEYDADARALTD